MYTWSRKELEVYQYWQIRDAGDKLGKEAEIEKGRMEGKMEGKIEVARNLKADGISIEVIMRNTGLSREEIEGLASCPPGC